MKTIPLSEGRRGFAVIDDEDYEELSKCKWSVTANGYALRGVAKRPVEYNKNGRMKTKIILMHRHILGLENPKIFADHINGNKLDNRRSNLRIVTPAQNACNRKIQSNNRLGFKGVTLTPEGRFSAHYGLNRRSYYIGNFRTPEEAHAAYLEKTKEVFGEFANAG